MKTKNTILSILIVLSAFVFNSCEKNDPSVLKIFVRSSGNILIPDAQVRLVGDVSEGTPEYMDERRTNAQGVATFELDELFDGFGKKEDKVAYFTVYARDTSELYTQIKARAKQYLTSSETITLDE